MKTKPAVHSFMTRTLHWINAALILFLMVSGDAAEALHITAGIACLVLTVLQVGWYVFGPKPTELTGLSPLRKLAFKWNHHLILLAALFALLTGVAAWTGGGDDLHEASVVPIILLLLMHVGGVFLYQLTKGNTLGRMAPLIFGKPKQLEDQTT